jgi:hypothetical protein
MGLYEWRFRISMACEQPAATPTARHAQWPSGMARVSAFIQSWQGFSRLYATVRTYCF